MLLRCCVVSLVIGLLYNKKVKYETVSTLCHISTEMMNRNYKVKRKNVLREQPRSLMGLFLSHFTIIVSFLFLFLNKTFVSKFRELNNIWGVSRAQRLKITILNERVLTISSVIT